MRTLFIVWTVAWIRVVRPADLTTSQLASQLASQPAWFFGNEMHAWLSGILHFLKVLDLCFRDPNITKPCYNNFFVNHTEEIIV